MKELLEKIVADYEARMKEFAEEREVELSEASAYNWSLDEDGVPYSHGNSDDVYSDGFTNGHSDGQYDLAVELLAVINEAQSGVSD